MLVHHRPDRLNVLEHICIATNGVRRAILLHEEYAYLKGPDTCWEVLRAVSTSVRCCTVRGGPSVLPCGSHGTVPDEGTSTVLTADAELTIQLHEGYGNRLCFFL